MAGEVCRWQYLVRQYTVRRAAIPQLNLHYRDETALGWAHSNKDKCPQSKEWRSKPRNGNYANMSTQCTNLEITRKILPVYLNYQILNYTVYYTEIMYIFYFMLCPYFKEASGKLMKVLKRATKPKRCIWVKVHELNLFDLSKMKLRSDLIATFKYHHKEKLQDIKDLFTPVERSIKRIHGWNQTPEKIQMRH